MVGCLALFRRRFKNNSAVYKRETSQYKANVFYVFPGKTVGMNA